MNQAQRKPPAFSPDQAPDLVIDWERVGRDVQAFRTMTGTGVLRLSQASGVSHTQIRNIEKGLPVSADIFMRLCVFLGREPAYFCKVLASRAEA